MGRGRKRKFNPNIPDHIDQDKLPNNCYWDNSYSGHWYTTYRNAAGKSRRKKIADPDALLSDLHKAIELENGINKDSFSFLVEQYFDSIKFKELKPKTKKGYESNYKIIQGYITQLRKPLSSLPIRLWDDPLVQGFVDRMAIQRGPSTARLLNSFIRRVFQWNLKRGNCKHNPAIKTELPKERKKQHLPTHFAYYALLNHARKNGTYGARFKGSCPHYIWIIMEIEYLCRQRGIECRTSTDAHLNDDGLLTERAKGSRDNITNWNDRLQEAVRAAQKARDEIYARHHKATPLNPKDRPLIVNTLGETLKESAYHSAWQRFVTGAIKQGVISKEDRFSLHDLKRMGITDTKGTKEEKLEASGHLDERMLPIYDKSVPKVNPSAD